MRRIAFNAPILIGAWWLTGRWHLAPMDSMILILFALGANLLGFYEGENG